MENIHIYIHTYIHTYIHHFLQVPGFPFFHDFAVTKNFYIFNRAAVEMDTLSILLGVKSPIESMAFRRDQGAKLYLVPRDISNPTVEVVEVDPHFVFHYANAFEEEEDGSIVFDAFRCDELLMGVSKAPGQAKSWLTMDYADNVPYPLLTRYTLQRASNNGEAVREGDGRWLVSKKVLSNSCLDFSAVNPAVVCRRHRFVYASAGIGSGSGSGSGSGDERRSSPLQGLVKVDTQLGIESRWFPEAWQFLGEPCFVPKKISSSIHPSPSPSSPSNHGRDEDDGYILTFLNDGAKKTTEFVIFDAKDIEKGPISRSPISAYIPFGLHGSFADGLVFNFDDVLRRFTVSKALDSKSWNEMTGGFSGLGLSYGLF